jgi:hypothetical protein
MVIDIHDVDSKLFNGFTIGDISRRMLNFQSIAPVSGGMDNVQGGPNGNAHGWYYNHGLPQLDKHPGVNPFLGTNGK